MKHLHPLLFVLILALSGSLNGQVAYVLDSGLPGLASEVYLPSPAYPAGGAGFFGAVPIPTSGALAGGPFGGMAIDQVSGYVYATDGLLITADPNPLYPPFTPPLPPIPPAPAPFLLTGVAIDGMAIDSIGGILWLTDGLSIGGFTPFPPYAPVTPAVLLPFLVGGAPLTGLGWDSATGSLWGCDAFGLIYNFTPGGAPIGPQPVSILPVMAPAFLVGLSINGSTSPGSIGAPFCSTQLPGYYVCVTDGPFIYDALAPGAPAIVNPTFVGGPARGLAFSNDFQILPGGVGCSTGFFPIGGWAKATHTGPGGANAIRMVGGPPTTSTLLLYDTCPMPGGLFVPASQETLWINPLSPTFAFAPLATDAAGSITVPISFVPSVAGITFAMQFAVFDPFAPLGYCLTDGFQFTSGTQ